MQTIKDYLGISLATLLIAIAVVFYLIPCEIVTGSVSGLSLLLSQIIPLSTSMLVLIMNIATYLIGAICLGKKFGLRSLYVSILLPILMKILLPVGEVISLRSDNLLINISLFLILISLGQTLLFLLDTASGGLDTIAEVLSRKSGCSVGLMVGIIGLLVSIVTINVYGVMSALIGALVTIINGLIINMFMMAYENRKVLVRRLLPSKI